MNFVLPTIFIIFFLMPGFVFRKAFFESEIGLLEQNSFYTDITWAVLISFIAHSILFMLLNYVLLEIFFFRYIPKIEPRIAFYLLSGKALTLSELNAIFSYPLPITFYFSIINIGSFLIARKSQDYIMSQGLDCKYSFLKFKNPWFYLLSGRVTKLNNPQSDEVDFTEVNILFHNNTEVERIYTGYLGEYRLKGKTLEYIVLYDAKKKEPATSTNIPEYTQIKGDLLVIKYEEIKNINFTYRKLPSLAQATTTTPIPIAVD